jgi:hypothetical protein
MIALLVLVLALPLFAVVAYGVVATEDHRDRVVTGHRRTRATRPADRLAAATVRRIGWLVLTQTGALLVGLVLRVLAQR